MVPFSLVLPLLFCHWFLCALLITVLLSLDVSGEGPRQLLVRRMVTLDLQSIAAAILSVPFAPSLPSVWLSTIVLLTLTFNDLSVSAYHLITQRSQAALSGTLSTSILFFPFHLEYISLFVLLLSFNKLR